MIGGSGKRVKTTGTAEYHSGHIRRPRATKVEVERRRESLFGIVSDMQPMTVRQVFYQATVRGIVEFLPYNWLADNIRWRQKPRSALAAAIREQQPVIPAFATTGGRS